MRLVSIAATAALLAGCGSNVPPANEQASTDGGMQHPSTPMTGDQDVDFATMMIAHHQGAIDMARQQVARGRDPEMKALAAKVIADQEREIAQMQAWLAREGSR